ncbi:MAG: hypothetical protein KBD85_03535 [Elusimicrobia bacterium]|nr:hypothetical protein [Elusimicrobiota bacterium]MBP9699069.1 hypothetical protein [Elusimicrobiota bacterium]
MTFPADRLPETVRALCLKEQKVDVQARLVGHTLYMSCAVDGLIGVDLDFDKKALETLEGVMMSGTRASLSTDAKVDFLSVRVADARLGSSITLLRYVPDIKGILYMRYSRDEFESRLVIETDGAPDPDVSQEEQKDITLPDFMARLVASRLHRQLTGNPLVSVFLRVSQVRGRADGGEVVLVCVRAEDEPLSESSLEVLGAAVAEVAVDVFKKYDPDGLLIHGLRVEENNGRVLWEKPLRALQSSFVSTEKK